MIHIGLLNNMYSVVFLIPSSLPFCAGQLKFLGTYIQEELAAHQEPTSSCLRIRRKDSRCKTATSEGNCTGFFSRVETQVSSYIYSCFGALAQAFLCVL